MNSRLLLVLEILIFLLIGAPPHQDNGPTECNDDAGRKCSEPDSSSD